MSNPAPITLDQLFRFYRGLPHQLAAIGELEADLRANGYAAAMRRDRSWFVTWSQSGKVTDWMPAALAIIREFEGLCLEAYRCPAGVWTIGYGATTLEGRPVREGDQINAAEAEQLLRTHVEQIALRLFEVLPPMRGWPANRQAAVISWAFNVGTGAVETSTFRRRILAGEDPDTVAREELARWNKAGDQPLPGLTRRRAAEVALFIGKAPMDTGSGQLVASPTSAPHLRLTRTGTMDGRGLVLLKLAYVKAGRVVDHLLVVSGAPRAQEFRTGAASRAGSLEPLPEGLYRIENIAWAGGQDNYSASWGAGLGPASVPLTYLAPGTTRRSAIEAHYDANHGTTPGTAGCVGMRSISDLQILIRWLRDTDPRDLYVDWGMGTCPAVKA
jgi:GH24 family phage-related lysozyme (muramidase)